MDKRMIEDWATVVEVVTRVVSAISLAALALVAVMMWKGGSFPSSAGTTGTPSAAVPVGAPDAVTQLTDDQWKQVQEGAPATKGKAGSKVTMVEFTDYQCPFCERYYTETYGQIMKNYVDNGKIQYMTRDLPLPFHPNAHITAEAARCAGDQKKYWEMHDKLFSTQTTWANESDPKPKLEQYAKDIGINSGNFMKCINDGKFKQAVDDDAALASSVGASGTPTFIINGKLLVGAQPYSEFERVLNEALGQ